MTVERRYGAREPIDLAVQIRYRKRRFITARGCNLSDQGLFLEVRNLTLPTGTLIELEFDCLGQEWRIPALVVHHQVRGVGVMFKDKQPQLFSGLSRPPSRPHPRNPPAGSPRYDRRMEAPRQHQSD
ncbi:pilus assembly protein PilZ [Thiocapsa imhoffii]|uniref:Pilus assembly protein PilZ n=1 Tax=Thiocapsa imhoffii TaxID=382777 RepID=A0A9X1B8V5_9GAMM|nr:PilZ domain-containing protein [Thiocapsa imhoffii]MBK1644391.1 pilus assembly protein PilZ [Thiocapsa imhoffii]